MAMSDTRRRMVDTAVRMFQREGYHATSWRALVDEAGTPWGSIKHHFPGGKEELGAEAVRAGCEMVTAALRECLDRNPDPGDAVDSWFDLTADVLRRSNYTQGCPMATVALEAVHTSEAIRDASRQALDEWQALLADRLHADGASRAAARDTALLVIALLEGALLMARIRTDAAPLRAVSRQARAMVQAVVP